MFTGPIIVGNSVIAIKNENLATAPTVIDSFNIANGAVNWSTPVNYSDTSGLGYGGGYVAFGTSVTVNSQVVGSLNVLNASSGAKLYSVPLPTDAISVTIATDTTTTLPVAYVTGNVGAITAVRLGPTSGTTLWSTTVLAGGTVSSIAGNMLLTANPDQYYAIDRTTGAINHFFKGMSSGGGGLKPVVDTAHGRFYIYGSLFLGQKTESDLIAYSYHGSTITQIWKDTQSENGASATPAIDSAGNVYLATRTSLMKINGATGAVLKSVPGNFYVHNSPIITPQYIWEFGAGASVTSAYVYNLSDLSLAAQFPLGSNANYLEQGAAMDPTHLIVDFGGTQQSPGFEVFTGTSKPVLPGDTNFDGLVNRTDLAAIIAHYGKPGALGDGDLNGDGVVGFADFQILELNFGRNGVNAADLSEQPVPEPYLLGLLPIIPLFCRRGVRRRIDCR